MPTRIPSALVRVVVAFVAYGVVAAVVAAPVAAERAIEGASFQDRLGDLPVEVSLAHNGVSTFDTGILGRLYWDRTGAAGFGAIVRATGPPEAGGTLSSYVDPTFVEVNAQFINDPEEVARVWGSELREQVGHRFLHLELGAFLVGGLLLTLIFRARAPFSGRLGAGLRAASATVAVTSASAASVGVAGWLFTQWDGSAEVTSSHPMPGVEELAFSSPQTLEVARQVRPFIEKNTSRIRDRVASFENTAVTSLRAELPRHVDALRPRPGEQILIAEADPQGSLVGTAVRQSMYALLQEHLGHGSLALRTISGDITSNGTVAERGFVEREAEAPGDIPTVVVKGDHDTETTIQQLAEAGVENPDFEVAEVGGVDVVAANDPAFKTLFGGLVINNSGVTETELGARLRQQLDKSRPDEPIVVLLHQPRSAAGYIGIDAISGLPDNLGRETTPWDDGIPDLPPGIINIGHLHDAAPPRIIWNTDGDQVTWTVLNQLGTSGGVEENPTFNRFSTPFSAPLKTLSVQLQYVDMRSGLQTGYASLEVAPNGEVTISDRTDIGLPIEQPTANPPEPARTGPPDGASEGLRGRSPDDRGHEEDQAPGSPVVGHRP